AGTVVRGTIGMRIKRILVPIDFSADSLSALAYARALAKGFHAELVILHVVDQTFLAHTPALSMAHPQWANLLDEQWRAAGAQLERLAAPLRKPHPRLLAILKRGAPASSIIAAAKRTGADLIVMGTHGRTGMTHMLIGSVAEKVMRMAHCAVLTVRWQ